MSFNLEKNLSLKKAYSKKDLKDVKKGKSQTFAQNFKNYSTKNIKSINKKSEVKN